MEQTALLFDIGRYRSTDGPGIRTILFFKGCPLACRWCSNPFGLGTKPQLSVQRSRCTACGRCVPACPQGCNAICDGTLQVDFTNCTACGRCVEACLLPCRSIVGKYYTAKQLFQEAYRDMAFYRRNGGGVTLSGGEVLRQHAVAAEVLRLCKRNYVNTCIETSAFGSWEALQSLAQYCNTVFVDLKHIDSQRHQALVGVPNALILENIQKLCAYALDRPLRVIIRVPIIPGCNDDAPSLQRAAQFVDALPGDPEINLLPYHNLGESKYDMLGLTYAYAGVEGVSKTDAPFQQAADMFARYTTGNRISLGGDAIDLSDMASR